MQSCQFRERRALSAQSGFWQSHAVFLALALAVPAAAAPGGDLDTMPIGDYVCEQPGDAVGPVGRHVPEEDFAIVTASSYRAGGTMGSYLLTGDKMVMSSGPHQGKRYHRQSTGFLRKLDPDGAESNLRCVLSKHNNR